MSAAFSGRQLLLAASAASYALVFVAFLLYELADMDALKELNHEAGPSAGDDALRRVADRLSNSL